MWWCPRVPESLAWCQPLADNPNNETGQLNTVCSIIKFSPFPPGNNSIKTQQFNSGEMDGNGIHVISGSATGQFWGCMEKNQDALQFSSLFYQYYKAALLSVSSVLHTFLLPSLYYCSCSPPWVSARKAGCDWSKQMNCSRESSIQNQCSRKDWTQGSGDGPLEGRWTSGEKRPLDSGRLRYVGLPSPHWGWVNSCPCPLLNHSPSGGQQEETMWLMLWHHFWVKHGILSCPRNWPNLYHMAWGDHGE